MSEAIAKTGGWTPAAPAVEAETPATTARYSTEHTPETRAEVYRGVYLFTLSFSLGGAALAVISLLAGDPLGVGL